MFGTSDDCLNWKCESDWDEIDSCVLSDVRERNKTYKNGWGPYHNI